MQAETRYAESGELNIAYQVLGDGPIDFVFTPGHMSHLEQNQWWPPYKSFLERAASFSRFIVFISALARAGEVLVSSTVKDLVVGSGIESTERGTHRLRGVPDEWHVHLVSDAGSER